MKRLLSMGLVSALMLSMVAGCGTASAPTEQSAEGDATASAEGAKKVGVLFYQFNDTYLSMVREELKKLDEADPEIEFVFQDAQGDQGKQNDEVDATLSGEVDALLVNLVDTGAAQVVIDKVKETEKPLIFFNREPDNIDSYATYDKAKFVGTQIEQAGIMQGELIKEYWEANKETADRNGNGKLDYVLLHGGLDNAEAIARSEYSVKTVQEAGIEVNKIGEQIALWDTEKAKQAMDAWVAKDEANIDVVFANNDGMAIGAVNSLKAIGYNDTDAAKHIAVFGVDATEEAKAAIEAGSMDGTVMQDAPAMAKAMYELAKNAASGKEFIEGTEYQYDESGVAVRIPYAKYEK